jgi:hypothetical protein
MLADVDNWDLRDHRQQATRVQNRHNVQVGSRDNQQKPRTGKGGFLHHFSDALGNRKKKEEEPNSKIVDMPVWETLGTVGARHAHVCKGEDLDPSRVVQISWW